jgi:hypothetical protein
MCVLLGWEILILHSAAALVLTEDFSTDPMQNGWAVAGDSSLFHWDSTNQNLRVTWDSSQPNSYFYRRLGTILARTEDFGLAFDVRLDTIGPGTDPAKSATFPIAIGFINLDVATSSGFIRGTGTGSPDLAELAYFWDSGFGATAWPTIVSTNSAFNYNGRNDYAILELTAGDTYHIAMLYAASNQTLSTTITNVQSQTGARLTQLVNTNFTDFRLTALSVSSYSDAGQAPAFAGSVLAQGVIDNVVATFPVAPVQKASGLLHNGVWQVQFGAAVNWTYTLQRSSDLQSWTNLVPSMTGTGGTLTLSDTNATAAEVFYRVRADRL